MYHYQICSFTLLSSLFILMIVSLPVQKLFNLMYSYLFIFFLYFLCLGDISAKILLRGISEILLPIFSSRSSIMPQLIFKSFIHFEFIPVYGVSLWSSLISLHVPVQFSQHHLLKRLFLLHFMFLPPLSNINWPQRFGFISLLSILFHWSVSVLMPVPGCFDYSGLLIQLSLIHISEPTRRG